MTIDQTGNQENQSRTKQADILIVDDIPDNIRFLSSFLVDQGYQVRKAINGQMAFTAIRTLVPDLILLDINLPDINGYEICRQLKNEPSTGSIPVLFLSAGNEAIDKVKAFQLGAADYITKPFYLEEVLARIQTQLSLQELQQELQAQNLQLRSTLEELKVAQANLVQQEKMTTLKKVVAGVAHEVNNPLSFISGNIKPAQEYIRQLLTLIEAYQQKYGDTDPIIQELLEDIDLEFTAADLDKILNSIKNGSERIHSVILALRIFTRLDESGVKQVNIHESLESVFGLLHYRLVSRKDGVSIQVKKEYEDLPLITGYPDQLNQAFFNLLGNAIDAIEEKLALAMYGNQIPEISVSTKLTDQKMIAIRIRDNGSGIAEANQHRIFEPFFTTKSAGQGVGLGLATSRRIIEELHRGCLTYCSSIGVGTEFLIKIPA